MKPINLWFGRSLKTTTWLFNLIMIDQRNLFRITSFTLFWDLCDIKRYIMKTQIMNVMFIMFLIYIPRVKISVMVHNSFTSTKHTSSLKLYVVPSNIIRCKLSACRVTVSPQLGDLSARDSSVWFPLFYRHSLFFLRKSFSKFLYHTFTRYF